MNWLETTAQLSQIAGVVSVIFAALSIRSNTRLSKRQWNVDTYNLYSERHQKAVENFPNNAFYNRFDDSQLPPRSPELTAAVRRYLFVIQSVDYLAYQKYLDASIWNVWRKDMQRTLRCQLIYREWPDLKQDFIEFESFTQFVEQSFQNAEKGDSNTDSP
ncbi:hypothetical protein [cf. Phormidesmis sp. LEGE 11477]|uniref:hypothetical protein n=1 Tax=cf. Phormidesmis sp. LEGE 11477 TaxID=1828680 RepID=UPI00187F368B|nr:hypothetical protein [cf. Phormidesmis sp. LEGE 11477]MBE9060705.1 hypothetical protein [cf. Phormidesmis sp. LEGE 11477]